ncbi:MAG: mechanosensitive ion channel [Rhodoluna sp.]|nr:mechanosensitive ion channel [Rhodoluna sp.]
MEVLTKFWTDWHTPIVIVLILVGGVISRAILIASVRRIVKRVVDGVSSESSPLAKARVVARTNTIGSVLGNLITWSITVAVISAILSELGIAVGAIIAGAGILGAAVGFGAQSLVRDLISGLFILFEDQFGVGDSVDLGEASGIIEEVGLRVTQVRDVEGTLWYVRNGEIVRVGNKSQGWSRVVLDIAFDYGVSVDKATEVVEKAAATIKKTHAEELIGEPEVWGIQNVTGDQYVLRLVQQVTPKSPDAIARELRNAIKAGVDKAKLQLASEATQIFVK